MLEKSTYTTNKKIFFLLLALSVFCLFFKRAAFNITQVLVLIFSLYTVIIYKEKTITVFKTYKTYIYGLLIFLMLNIAINSFHLWQDSSALVYAVQKKRWILTLLLLLPTTAIYLNEKIPTSNRQALLDVFTYAFASLSIILIIESLIKAYSAQSPLQVFAFTTYPGARAGWLFNPVLFSKLCAFGACISLALIKLNSKSSLKALSILSLVNFLFLILLSQTRAAWIGTLIAIFAVLFFFKLKWKTLAWSLLVLVSTGYTYNSLYPKNFIRARIASFSQKSNISNNYRIEHLKANFKLSLAQPLLGVGYAQNKKKEVIGKYLNKFSQDESVLYDHPHNEYIDNVSATGWPLFFIFIFILIYPLFLGTRAVLSKHSRDNQSKTIILISSVSFLFFQYPSLFFDMATLLDWYMLSICYSVILYYSVFINTPYIGKSSE